MFELISLVIAFGSVAYFAIAHALSGVERSNLIYQNFKTGEVRSRHLKLWNTKEERELGN